MTEWSGSTKDVIIRTPKLSQDRADLCVVIGTSLSGLDTDLIAETASRGCSLGLVIVGLQQTRLDGEAIIKISAEADRLFERLAITLRLRFSVPKVLF